MTMWSLKVLTLLLFCYASLSTGHERLRFVSSNFFTVLHWDEVQPEKPGEEVLYSVHYWSDVKEQSYEPIKECQNITNLSCDLTGVMRLDPNANYRAKVLASGRFHGITKSFKPIAKTNFTPPKLSTSATVTSLYVNVTLPSGPYGVSVGDIFSCSKRGPYKKETVYTLKITSPQWAALVNETSSGRFVINLKNNQTEFCGHVVYKPTCEWGRPESAKATFCVTLPAGPTLLLPWIIVTAALLTAIISISLVYTCHYVTGGKTKAMPRLLVSTSSSPPRVLQPPDGNLHISKAEIYVESEQTVYATIRMNPSPRPVKVGGYSPQDLPFPSPVWQSSGGSSVGAQSPNPNPNPADVSGQSSEIYSVVAVHVPAEPNQDSTESRNQPESPDGPGPKPRLPPSPGPDLGESTRPLLLETVRDANGQLALPSLIYQLQKGKDDAVSERKPLLSDLIVSRAEDGPSLASFNSYDGSEWSDSGCDDSNATTPTQPDSNYCNSNYVPTQTGVSYSHSNNPTQTGAQTGAPYANSNYRPTQTGAPYSHTNSCPTQTGTPYSHTNSCPTQTRAPYSHTNSCPSQTGAPYSHTNSCPTQTGAPYSHSNSCPTQTGAPYSHTNSCPTQTGAPYSHTNSCPMQTGAPYSHTNSCPTQTGAPYSHTKYNPTQTGAPYSHTNNCPTQTGTPYSHTNNPTQTGTPYSHSNSCPTQTGAPYSHSNSCPSQTGAPYSHTNSCPTQTGEPYSHSNNCPNQTGTPYSHTKYNPTQTGAPYSHTNNCPTQTGVQTGAQTGVPYSHTKYNPTQTGVPYFQRSHTVSGYKQNYMPSIAPKDCCEYRKTDTPWTWTAPEEEEEDEEDDAGGGGGGGGRGELSRPIVLGGWVVQIQD